MEKSLALAVLACLATMLLCGCGANPATVNTNPTTTAQEAVETPAEAPRSIAAVGAAPVNFGGTVDDGQMILGWESVNPGDYNLDCSVSGLDVFPLAANFNEPVVGNPGNECIDGNGDGTLNGMDLFLISVNFQKIIDGVNVYAEDASDGPFNGTPLNGTLIAYEGCNAMQWHNQAFEWGTAMFFAARSYDSGAEEYSAVSNVVELSGEPQLRPPSVVAAQAVSGEPWISLSWEEVSHPDLAGFNIYRSQTSGGTFTKQNLDPINGKSWIDGSAGWGATWYYYVTTELTTGEESDPSPEAVNPTPTDTPLLPPTSLSALPVPGKPWIDLGWMEVQHPDLAGYVVERAAESGGDFTRINGDLVESTTFRDEDAGWGARWYYRVITEIDGGDQSDPSDEIYNSLYTAEWTASTVDVTANAGVDNSIMISPIDDMPRIAYWDSDNDDLELATWDGSSWLLETVYSDGEVGKGPSIAAVPGGYWGVSYINRTNDTLNYAWFDGSSWHNQVVDSTNTVGGQTRLAISSTGRPAITYMDDTNYHILAARWDGSAWVVEDFGEGNDHGFGAGFDSSDNQLAGFHTDGFQLATWDEGWTTQELIPFEDVTGFIDFAMKSGTDDFAFSHYDQTEGGVRCLWEPVSGGGFVDELLDSDMLGAGFYTAIAFDSNGYPAVAYLKLMGAEHRLARWNGEEWTIESYHTGPSTNRDLVFDYDDTPWISFYATGAYNQLWAISLLPGD